MTKPGIRIRIELKFCILIQIRIEINMELTTDSLLCCGLGSWVLLSHGSENLLLLLSHGNPELHVCP
jgi:hypothetical protein